MIYTVRLHIRGNIELIGKLKEFVEGETLPRKTKSGFEVVPQSIPFAFQNIVDPSQSLKKSWGSGEPIGVQLLIHLPNELIYVFDTYGGIPKPVILELSKRFPLAMDLHWDCAESLKSGDITFYRGKCVEYPSYRTTLCSGCGEVPYYCGCTNPSTVIHRERVRPREKPPEGRKISIITKD